MFDNYALRAVSSSGAVATVAGRGVRGYPPRDGAGAAVTFSSSWAAVAVGNAGLYVADDSRVRLFSPGSGAVHVRYEPVSPPLRFTPKARTHTDAEYATYVPEGILRRAWMERHHNSVPSVMVRMSAFGAVVRALTRNRLCAHARARPRVSAR